MSGRTRFTRTATGELVEALFPLRKVVEHRRWYCDANDLLECGHSIPISIDAIERPRRRCFYCKPIRTSPAVLR